MVYSRDGWVYWGARGGGRGAGGMVIGVWVREPVFRNIPHSYTCPFLKKTDPFIYIWSSEMLTPLIFYTHSYRIYSSLFVYMFTNKKYNCILQIKRHLSIILYTGMHSHWLSCLTQLFLVDSHVLITWTTLFFENLGLSYINQEKSSQSYTFCWKKKEQIIYLAVLIKGAIREAHPYYAICWGSILETPWEASDQNKIKFLKHKRRYFNIAISTSP